MLSVLKTDIRSLYSVFIKNNLQLRLKSTFKVATLHEKSEFRIEEAKVQKLGKNDVRVQVQYCTIDSTDCKSFENHKDEKKPFVPGYEFAGEVLEVGSNVKSDINVGSRVVGLNLSEFGGLAEQCIASIQDLWLVPENLTSKNAAPIIYDYSSAIYGFAFMCTPKQLENKLVLLSYESESLGLAGLDVAANIYKAKVIAVCNKEEGTSLARDKGAFASLKFNKDDLKKMVLKYTKEDRVSIVYDTVGGEVFDSLIDCIKPRAKIMCPVSVYEEHDYTVPPNTNYIILSLKSLRSQSPELYRQIVTDTLEMADQRLIRTHTGKKFKFEDINKAVKFVQTENQHGKVIIEISD